MRKANYKGRRTRRTLSKCKEVVKTYDDLQNAYADILESNEDIVEIRCNVLLDDKSIGEYTSDFVCMKANGELMVRECVWKKNLTKPSTVTLMDFSQLYWRKRGVYDWKVVVEKERSEKEESE